ncbi:hypothetical protein Pmar_PMAR002429 [Perkinsus marinus ATCC 50983]|uniref:Uncharacterized protein n=1 Tax=Perkinsus marinus (strain ATCC 50983 / TXsc) TaxID=423536 RepID=C5KSM5_PERM5|nr:hypothetical protein Pmar_PMAR002429 [Perkinsus marinus ATCC 50983]EER12519.1 hypothetical protein Pmar_PMAR002429 [Perkinsus marinus ATCC 50983]|eukprot:XP_002780724.1 hypothetical protein Pmar_PMAR002429 [Perkinsus marinus ATCC 50983]
MGSLDDLIRSGEALASGSIKSGMATEEILRGILQAVNIGKIDFDVDDDEKRSKMVRRKVAKLVDILIRISSTLLSELTAVDCEMLLREYIAESVVLRRLVLGLLHEWSPHASTMTPWLRTISHHRSPLLSDCLEGPMDEHLLQLLNVVVDVVHSIDVDDPQALWFIDFDLACRLVDALPSTKESPLMIEALKLLVRLSRDDHSLARLLTTRAGCIAPPCEIIDFRNRLSTGLTSILASELANEMIQVDSLQCALTLLSPNDAHPSEDTAHHKPCEWGVELLSSSNKPDVVAAASHCVLSFLCADSALASRLSSCVCQGALGSLLKAVGQHPSTVEPLAEVVLLTGPSQVRCLPNMIRAGAALARMNHLPRSHRILQMAADCCSLLNSPVDATELLISVVDSVRSGIDIALVMPCLGAAIDLHPSLPPDEGIKVVHTLLEASANARSVKEGVALCAKLVEQLSDNNICPEIRKLFINSPELRLAILSVDGGGRLAKLVLTGSLPAGLLSSSLEGVSRLPTATHWQLALAMSPQLDRSVAVCLLAWLFFDVYECGGHIEALLAPTGSFNRSEMDFNVALLLASLHASLDQSPQGACLIELLSTASFSWEAEECTLHSTEVIIDTIVFLAADVDGIDALTCRRLMDLKSSLGVCIEELAQLSRNQNNSYTQ